MAAFSTFYHIEVMLGHISAISYVHDEFRHSIARLACTRPSISRFGRLSPTLRYHRLVFRRKITRDTTAHGAVDMICGIRLESCRTSSLLDFADV